MYTVQMEHECGCFKRSEYTNGKSFDKQQDAYNYANILTELMNEEFCTKHLFVAQKTGGDEFLIRVTENPNAGGSCSTGSCGPCGCD
jgi:hypothetical protein